MKTEIKYYTIKMIKCGSVHICTKKEINGVFWYIASNKFNKWKVDSNKLILLE